MEENTIYIIDIYTYQAGYRQCYQSYKKYPLILGCRIREY